MIDLVVTRHKGLVDYLQEIGLADEKTEIIEHASPSDIKGKHVAGVLPHSLACLTKKFTAVPVRIPRDQKGDLSLEEIKKYVIGEPVSYLVVKMDAVQGQGQGEMAKPIEVIVSNHDNLKEFLEKEGVIDEDAEIDVIREATSGNIGKKRVAGILPMHLSCLTKTFTEVALRVPPEKRGESLSSGDLAQYSSGIQTYTVRKV